MRTVFLMLLVIVPVEARAEPWVRHVVDRGSRGADGVRLADINADGLPDVVTGWEEGGMVRICLHPGHAEVKRPWPAVAVGNVASPEDAVFCDLDGDGATDVVSCCEGKTQTMFFHWSPSAKRHLLDKAAWRTEAIPCTKERTRWMFATSAEIDGQPGPELFVASKAPHGMVGWLGCEGERRDSAAWSLHALCRAGWIMSLVPLDMDDDGDPDVLVSDRKGERRGVYWLENPGPPNVGVSWREHRIGASGEEVMFLAVGDLDADGCRDVLVAVKPRNIVWFSAPDAPKGSWKSRVVSFPERFGTAKAVSIGDMDGDGRPDLVVSCEHAEGERSGVFWMKRVGLSETAWTAHDIAGPQGVKYDLIELLDLDGDGDLDVLTCEERDNLGLIWYENPRTAGAGIPSHSD